MPTENELLKLSLEQLKSTSGITDATTITQVDRLKVALCGDPKSGKSYVIAKTARKPLLHYDFDDRRESIAGIDGVYIKTLVDLTDENPVAWNIVESDLNTLLYQKEKKELPWKSIAFDSATYLRKYAEHQAAKDSNKLTTWKQKIGVVNYIIPKDWDAVVAIQKMLEGLLSKAFSLDIDVYMTFHTRPEKDTQKSSKDNIVYKENLTVEPQNLKMLLPKFNEVWRCFIDNDNTFKIQTKQDWRFNAATALHNLGQIEEADIGKLLEKHNSNK